MKRMIVLAVSLVILQVICAQSKSELQQRIVTLVDEKTALQEEVNNLRTDILRLKEQILDLKTENQDCKSKNEQLKANIMAAGTTKPESAQGTNTQQQNITSSTPSQPGRCQATTAQGTQCSRNAEAGSKYCWQHKAMYEISNTKSSVSSSTSSKSTSTGRTIYTGPRGGKYYINSNGNKTYIKK